MTTDSVLFQGQPVAVVSGITGGIGSVVAAELVKAGYAVVGITRPGKDRAALPWPLYQVDITQPARVARVVDDILAKHQRCDLLVTAHGHSPVTSPSGTLVPDEFLSVLQTDVFGSFVLAQAFGRIMLGQPQGGGIVFVSSLHAKHTYPARPAYAAAKAGVCGMARSLALEWGQAGVRVNTILPWQVDGSRNDLFIAQAKQQGQDLREAYLQRCPTRTFVAPVDIARAVLFLAQTASMNGAELVLDGGVSASMWHQGFVENAS